MADSTKKAMKRPLEEDENGSSLAEGFKKTKTEKEEQFLLELPPVILENILVKVANRSYADLVRCKNVCKAMREVVQTDTFYRTVDLFSMDARYRMTRSIVDFNRNCVDAGNPSAIFILGTTEFFKYGKIEEGLSTIQKAAERGYEIALYTYAFLTRIMFPGRVFNSDLVNLSREIVRSAKQKVKASSRRSWNDILTPSYVEKVSGLHNLYVEVFRCKCGEINRHKPERFCDACFWKTETIDFSHIFRNCTLNIEELQLEYNEDVE